MCYSASTVSRGVSESFGIYHYNVTRCCCYAHYHFSTERFSSTRAFSHPSLLNLSPENVTTSQLCKSEINHQRLSVSSNLQVVKFISRSTSNVQYLHLLVQRIKVNDNDQQPPYQTKLIVFSSLFV